MFNVDYNKIKRLDEMDSLTLTDKGLKLSEETGEALAEILSYIDANNKSKSAKGTPEVLAEELIDVIIVAKSAILNTGLSSEELNDIVDAKLDKWESKIRKRKEILNEN